MSFIDIQHSFPLYYEETGSGYPILFIHPPGMGSITFKYQRPLGNHFRIILMDLRGNGQSGFNSEKISINLFTRDIIALLDALQIKKTVICGYSNGGSIALDLCLTYPERVSGIILLGGFSEVNSFILYTEFKMGINIVKHHGLNILAKILGKMHGTSKEFQKELEQYFRKTNDRILYETYKAGLAYNCTNRLSELKIPILLIDGALDIYMHHYQHKIREYLPNAELIFVTNAFHQLPTKHSNEINQIISAFMNKHGFRTSSEQ